MSLKEKKVVVLSWQEYDHKKKEHLALEKCFWENDVREAVEKWLKYMKNDGGELSYRIHKDKFQQIFGVWEE